MQHAEANGIRTLIYPAPKGTADGLTAAQLASEMLQGLDVSHVLLAGYLKVGQPGQH
jgi:hypothetical protein